MSKNDLSISLFLIARCRFADKCLFHGLRDFYMQIVLFYICISSTNHVHVSFFYLSKNDLSISLFLIERCRFAGKCLFHGLRDTLNEN
jgi:hypothetical protein